MASRKVSRRGGRLAFTATVAAALVASTLALDPHHAVAAQPQAASDCTFGSEFAEIGVPYPVGDDICQVVYTAKDSPYTFTAPAGVSSVDVFLVGGGGGGGGGATQAGGSTLTIDGVDSIVGGAYLAGGGGAGGSLAIYNDVTVDTATPVTVTIGAGGTGGSQGLITPSFTSGSDGSSGGTSSFGTLTALGGGGGKGANATTGFGGDGGSTPPNPSADDSAPAVGSSTGQGGAGATTRLAADTRNYWTAAGGGASPGDNGDDAVVTNSPKEYVKGGDGGAPIQFASSDPTSLFAGGGIPWENSLWAYNGDAFYRAYLLEPAGFAPGGGGAATGREYCDEPTCSSSGSAGDQNTGGLGQGTYAWSYPDSDPTGAEVLQYLKNNYAYPIDTLDPSNVKRATNGFANDWAFGAGGGGGLATSSQLGTAEWDGAPGSSGLVVVRWKLPAPPSPMTCVVTPYHAVYTGRPHNATATCTADGVPVTGVTVTGTSHISPGSYDDWYTVSAPNHLDETGFMTNTILVKTSLTYTGTQGLMNAGTPLKVSAKGLLSQCKGAITYSLDVNPLTGVVGEYPLTVAKGQVRTTGWRSGAYLITAGYAGDGYCAPAFDFGVITIGRTGAGSAVGGGSLDESAGTTRFGFEVRRTKASAAAATGSLVWTHLDFCKGYWKFTGSLTSYSTSSNGVGIARGTGVLSYWSSTGSGGNWVDATTGPTTVTITFQRTTAATSGRSGRPGSPGTFRISFAGDRTPGVRAWPNWEAGKLTSGQIKMY